MRKAGLVGMALMAAACAAQPDGEGPPDWLSGYWLSCDGGTETSENWIGAGRGVLIGSNITRQRRINYEFLRIAPNESGGLSYFSMPNGRAPATEFVMVAHEGQRAVFENAAHDFPQRIIYAREGDMLTARIEDMSGAEGAEWRFHRAHADATCRR